MSSRYDKQFSRFEFLDGLDEAFMNALLTQRDRLTANLAGGAFTIDHELNGGWRRILCLTNAVFPASGVTHFELDSSLDYRDRLLFFCGPPDLDASQIIYPGHPDDGSYNLAGSLALEGRVYYTGAGYAEPSVTGPEYWHFHSSEEILVYADATTGALKLTLIGGGAGSGQLATLGMLFVSPKMNEQGLGGGTDLPLFDALDEELVEPHDLNNAQDGQHMEQTQGGDCLPLGPVLEGDPPLARSWTVRGEEKRQPITNPQLRRYVSFRCDAAETRVLDRAFDWRDRVIHIAGCFSETTERRPGAAGDTLAGSFAAADTDPTVITGYTGAGATATPWAGGARGFYQHTNAATPGFFYADESTGWLMFSMVGEAGNIETFNALVLASPQLGPRSGMREARLFDDPDLGKVGAPIADSVASDLVGIVARYRADRGTALDGGMVAGIADQSGNGNHLVQTDPTKRLFAPQTRAALNNAEAWGASTTRFMETLRALPAATDGYYIGIILEDVGTTSATPFAQVLALTTEGSIETEIDGTDVRARWQPNATATPDYEAEEGTTFATGLIGIAFMWSVDGGDTARLLPEVAVRDSGGIATGSITTTSPAATGNADVQATLWRLFEGLDAHIAEVVICNAAQSAVDDFLTSADIVTRYGF